MSLHTLASGCSYIHAAGDYKLEPAEYWANVSPTTRDFVKEGVQREADVAFSIKALNRMTATARHLSTDAQALSDDVKRFKEESAAERMEDASIVHQHLPSGNGGSGFSGTPGGSADVTAKLEEASLEE
ncbi:hypothetical protein C8J57DRAFT_1480770 [Mycena rebaudengoi]|nr:hypothetical protein C8J57DRAFT_1480770 [Mycena rebaudengoi]